MDAWLVKGMTSFSVFGNLWQHSVEICCLFCLFLKIWNSNNLPGDQKGIKHLSFSDRLRPRPWTTCRWPGMAVMVAILFRGCPLSPSVDQITNPLYVLRKIPDMSIQSPMFYCQKTCLINCCFICFHFQTNPQLKISWMFVAFSFSHFQIVCLQV